MVGENVTLADITEDRVCVGDVVQAGSALLQVSGPRIPCVNLARRIGRPDWAQLTLTENRTGFYLRVLRTGHFAVGDTWQLQERLNECASIPEVNRALLLGFDPAFAERMLTMRGLGAWWREQAVQRLSAHVPSAT